MRKEAVSLLDFTEHNVTDLHFVLVSNGRICAAGIVGNAWMKRPTPTTVTHTLAILKFASFVEFSRM